MVQNRSKSGTLLLAGLAAYAYYKYSKMAPEERSRLFDGLKEKGKKLFDEYVPEDIKNKLTKKDTLNSIDEHEESSYYAG